MTTWNKITKPTGTTWTKITKAAIGQTIVTQTQGSPIGLLLALTYSTTSSMISGGWTKVAKPANTTWTKITKAT